MKKIKVAIIPSEGFGDGLIQLVIANNLQKLGYQVTYYHDFVKAFEGEIEHIRIKNDLRKSCKVAELEQYHIVLYDSHSKFARNLDLKIKTWLDLNAIPYILSSSKIDELAPSLERLKQRLGKEVEHLAEFFLKFHKRPRVKKLLDNPPMVEQIKRFFQYKLGSPYATDTTGINLEVYKKLVKNDKRVVIHPTSSSENKNWKEYQYIELAGMLKEAGWEPVFTVAPHEQARWLKLANKEFAVPEFKSIKELAEFYTASFAFIGNDSGNAHLASLLGLPNLVIFKRWRKKPGWRPGWTKTNIVLADFRFRFKKKNWQKGIKPQKVFSNFNKMVSCANN